MNNFFSPPFPFFTPYSHKPYNHYNVKQNNNSTKNNQICSTSDSNKNTNNFSNSYQHYGINSNNLDINSNMNSKIEKNSITNNLKGNTISSVSFNPLYSLIPKSFGPLNININGFSDSNEPIFELFGIKLFLDDIIIICLLIFLYEEDVKDEMLYIILIMLLFS